LSVLGRRKSNKLLNWKIRYSKILRDTPDLFDPAFSVVEVGSGSFGIAQFLDRKVIGVEPRPPVAGNDNLEIVEGSILELPFEDDAIDYVLCVDVLEHLAAGVREAAIRELLRVARKKVILSCPCHVWAKAGEVELKQMFQNFGAEVPGWLREHLDFGLPMVQEILAPIIAAGCAFEVTGNETILQHYAGIALDWFFPMAQGVNHRVQSKSTLQPPVYGNEWDLYYSFMFTLNKRDGYFRARQQAQCGPGPMTREQAVYAVYHKEYPTSHLGRITPIYAGELALDYADRGLTDICVETERLPNRRWSELSAIYKVWMEGPTTGVVGFCHYRRFFDFTQNCAPVGRETNVTVAELAHYRLYDADVVASVADGSKIIVAKPHDTTKSIFEHYCELHNTNDYLELINYCSAVKNPLLPYFIEHFSDHFLFANNMFVVSWDFFSELCGFWFEILVAVVGRIPERDARAYQRRDVAFLSERVFDAWVRYRKQLGSEVIEVPILFVGGESGG
jgi:SAM-dependent methyltransferase